MDLILSKPSEYVVGFLAGAVAGSVATYLADSDNAGRIWEGTKNFFKLGMLKAKAMVDKETKLQLLKREQHILQHKLAVKAAKVQAKMEAKEQQEKAAQEIAAAAGVVVTQ